MSPASRVWLRDGAAITGTLCARHERPKIIRVPGVLFRPAAQRLPRANGVTPECRALVESVAAELLSDSRRTVPRTESCFEGIDPGTTPSRWSDWLLRTYAIINLESALERFEFLASPTAQLFYSKASFSS